MVFKKNTLPFHAFMLFYFFSVLASMGQGVQEIQSTSYVTAASAYQLKDGLPVSCIQKIFFDQSGKLWLTPCYYTSKQFGFDFFQFDGSKAMYPTFTFDSLHEVTSTSNWELHGEISNGIFYGTNNSQSVIFWWDSKTNRQHYTPLAEGEKLLHLTSYKKELFLLTQNENGYVQSGIVNGKRHIYNEYSAQLSKHFTFNSNSPFVKRGNTFWFLHQRKGIIKGDLNTHQMEFYPWSDITDTSILQHDFDFQSTQLIWNMLPAVNNQLLLYLGQLNGFFFFDCNTHQLSPLNNLNDLFFDPKEQGREFISNFTKDDAQNVLLVGGYLDDTLTYGVSKIQAILLNNRGQLINYSPLISSHSSTPVFQKHDPNPKYFSNNFMHKIAWVYDKGIKVLEVQPQLHIQSFPTSIGIRAITQFNDSSLLVNTDAKLMTLNCSDSALVDLISGADDYLSVLSPLILLKDQTVWGAKNSGSSGGFGKYHFTTQKWELIDLEESFDQFIFLNDSMYIIATNQGEIQLRKIEKSPNMDAHKVIHKTTIEQKVNDLYFDNAQTVWIATQKGGFKLTLTESAFSLSEITVLNGENILCLQQDKNGKLWMGTTNSGLLIYNFATGSLNRLTVADGLSSNTIAAILEDSQNYMWLSTFNGISVVSAQEKLLFVLAPGFGLINTEFNVTAAYKMPNGKLAFGGTKGIDIIDPQEVINTLQEKEPIQIFLTDVAYDGKKDESHWAAMHDLSDEHPILIPASNRYLSLDFALSSYTEIKSHFYYYRLIPANLSRTEHATIPWVEIGSYSKLTLTNLPVGAFTVQIRGTDQYGKISSAPLEVAIKVNQYFYKKWWFYIIVFIPFLLLFLARFIRLRQEKSRLEAEVNKRTIQLRNEKIVIEKQAEELKEISQAKTNFFTNISHEFRTPLTVILGMVNKLDSPSPSKKLIQRNAAQLLELINQILDLRKLDSGMMTTHLVQGDINKYIAYVLESFYSLAIHKEIRLTFTRSPQQFTMDYDAEKLNHIISNLLSNALKFSSPKGEIKVHTCVHENQFEIQISDNGIGISSKDLPYIFDRFFQAQPNPEAVSKGSGVGLALVKQLTELLGGSITVTSEITLGTTFKIRLPISNKAHLDTDLVEMLPANSPHFFDENSGLIKGSATQIEHEHTVLIVEDNADVREYIHYCLKDKFKVRFATDGAEGIRTALEEVPDLILSDVMMPKKSGFELCSTLKTDERTSHIPIVLLTAKADINSKIDGLNIGADAYLTKPFNESELLAQLDNLLKIRLRLQQRYQSIHNLPPVTDKITQQEDVFVLKIRSLILAHMESDDFGVPELCKLAGMSRTQLHNKIKSLTDNSTSQLIRRIRIEKAQELLKDPAHNVSEVSYLVGINSLPYFSRMFTEETGLSPKKFREKHLHKQ